MSTGPKLRTTPNARRERCRHRPISPGSPRPSELLRVFVLAGLAFIAAGAVAGAINAATGVDWVHWFALHLLFLGGISQLALDGWLRIPGAALTVVVAALSWRLITLAVRALIPRRALGI